MRIRALENPGRGVASGGERSLGRSAGGTFRVLPAGQRSGHPDSAGAGAAAPAPTPEPTAEVREASLRIRWRLLSARPGTRYSRREDLRRGSAVPGAMDPTTPVAANGRDSPSVSPRTPPRVGCPFHPWCGSAASGSRASWRFTALSSGGDAVSEEYRIWLTESPELNLAPGFVVAYDPTPVRVRVRKAEDEPPPTCLLPEVGFETQGMARAGGEMAASVYGFEGLSYWSAYWTPPGSGPRNHRYGGRPPTGKPFALADEAARRGEGLPHRPLLLGSSFATRATATGLEQTMNLGWFADLRFVVESPGCEPVEVVCVRERCRVQ